MRQYNGYIMREQIRDQVRGIMGCGPAPRRPAVAEESIPLYAVVTLSLVYLLAMALST
jgi:hypothetical protein